MDGIEIRNFQHGAGCKFDLAENFVGVSSRDQAWRKRRRTNPLYLIEYWRFLRRRCPYSNGKQRLFYKNHVPTLSEGDRLWYAVRAETGNGMQVGFAEPGEESLETTYWTVENRRQEDEGLECIASFTLRPLAKPGTYKLFLRATDGDLGNVKGSISIGFVADAIEFGADAS